MKENVELTRKQLKRKEKKARQEMLKNMPLRFVYFGTRVTDEPVYCVGYQIVDNSIKCSLTLCSPREEFVKPEALRRVRGRFAKGQKVAVIDAPLTEKPKYAEIKECIRSYIDKEMKTTGVLAGIKRPVWYTDEVHSKVLKV